MSSNPEAIARVCIDILIIALVGISAVAGWRKGLAAVIFSCFRWLICIVVSVFAAYPVRDLMSEKTGLADAITSHIKTTMGSSLTGSSFFMAIPEQMRSVFTSYQQNVAMKIANSMADTLLSVVAFLLIFVVLILVTKLFAMAISHRKKKGPVGIFNGILGACFGVLRGVFIISLVMLALFPLLSFADPRAVSPIVAGIRESQIAGIFYDHNPITFLFQMF